MMPVLLPPTAPPRAPVGARDPLGANAGVGWRRRIRLSLEAQRLRDLHMRPHDLSLFSGNQIHLIRVDGRLLGGWPTPRWEWVPALRPGSALEGSRHIGSHLDPKEDLYRPISGLDLRPAFPTPAMPNFHMGGSGSSVPRAPGSTFGVNSAVGAGVAVLALAVLVMMARTLEQCLDRRLFKMLRRRSDEWYSPNVLATNSGGLTDSESGEAPGLESPTIPPGDPPPPYSMCLPKSPRSPGGAEPPPPYSAAYVAFGAQDAQPRVHLNMPPFTRFQDTGQSDGAPRNCPVTVPVDPPEYSEAARNEDSERCTTDLSSSTGLGGTASPNNLIA